MARAIIAEICPASGVVGFEPLHAVRNCISVDGRDGNGVSGTWRAVHDRARRRRVRTGVVIGVIAVIGRGEGAADYSARNKSCTYAAPTPSAAIPPAAATPSAPPLHDLQGGRNCILDCEPVRYWSCGGDCCKRRRARDEHDRS